MNSKVKYFLFMMFLIFFISCSDNATETTLGKLGEDCKTGKVCDTGLVCDENNKCVEAKDEPCKFITCLNHGLCKVENNKAKCECESGYVNDGDLKCISSDVCNEVICSNKGDCYDDSGEARCHCNSGYVPMGENCVEAQDDGSCDPECDETSYCSAGDCLCKAGFEVDLETGNCKDIDECYFGNGGCAHICTNAIGSFECTCMNGYVLDEDGESCNKESCDNDGDCGEGFICVNDDCVDDPSICDPHCADGEICVNNNCVDDPSICDPACANGEICIDNNCVDPNACDPACEEWEICNNGDCDLRNGACNNDNDCGNGEICEGHRCVDDPDVCDPDCEDWEICNNGNCDLRNGACNNDNDCGNGEICEGHRCVDDPDVCDPACEEWEICNNRNCDLRNGRCANDNDCGQDQICNSNHNCEQDPDICYTDADCSGYTTCNHSLAAPYHCTPCSPERWFSAGSEILPDTYGSDKVLTMCGSQLAMGGDGNLVLWEVSEALRTGVKFWQTGTSGPGAWLKFQSDGNLVIYKSGQSVGGTTLWNSKTSSWHCTNNGKRLKVGGAFIMIEGQDTRVIWENGVRKNSCGIEN